MDRRTFLMGAPMVFGLREMLLGQDSPKNPKWFDEALARMKETKRDGVVIVGDGRALGEALLALTESKDGDVREIFVETVVVCMTPALAKRHFDTEKTRLLLDAAGKVESKDDVAVETYDDAKKFVESYRVLLHGKDGARLRAAAKRVADATLDEAIDKLDTDGATDEAAMAAVRAKAAGAVPRLVLARLEAVHKEGRERLRTIVDAQLTRALPYGSVLPRFASSCGEWVEAEEQVVKCGMAETPERSRKFLKFLTE
jgi:hypothetical protein